MILLATLLAFGLHGAEDDAALFRDVSREAGLDFRYSNGMSGSFYLPEIMGGGVALFDCDQDADLDVFLPQGGSLTERSSRPAGKLLRNRLETGTLSFEDQSAAGGMTDDAYGMGVLSADLDGDGRVDLYVLNLGRNRFWHNLGDCRFEDRTEASGLGDESWSISAVPFDYDRDGDLDLYVVNYLDFALHRHRICPSEAAAEDYCGPLTYPGQADRLYRNDGGGRFSEITEEAGVLAPTSRGMAATAADFNGDGLLDLYVANDQMPNHLWINQGDGTFADDALFAGVALNERGQVEASMGLEAADFDGDGDEDLFISNLRAETSTLYLGEGDGLFVDATSSSGLNSLSFPYTGFGTVALDADGDGCLYLAVVNGAIKALEENEGSAYPLHQPNQLFRCVALGEPRFEEASKRLPETEREAVSRGLAVGDIDNDGRPDLLLVNSAAPARLLLNQRPEVPWIGVSLVARNAAPDGLGSRVGLLGADGRIARWLRARSDGSYASSSDPRLLFASPGSAVRVRVVWTSGRTEDFDVRPGRYQTLTEGEGATR
ncbi:MAG: CRTAC1 family protein [Acidobacteriota bacterium]